MKRITGVFDLHFDPSDQLLSKSQIQEGLRDADGLISMLSDPIDREV